MCAVQAAVEDAEEAMQSQIDSLQQKIHLCASYDKLEILARRMWIQINGDDEFFEDSVAGQLPAGYRDPND